MCTSYLPDIEKNRPVSITQFTLKEIIRQTIFSIADNDTNKLMTGELFPGSSIVPSIIVSIPSSISFAINLMLSLEASIRRHSNIGIVVLVGTAQGVKVLLHFYTPPTITITK